MENGWWDGTKTTKVKVGAKVRAMTAQRLSGFPLEIPNFHFQSRLIRLTWLTSDRHPFVAAAA